jgi:transposase
MAQAKGKRPPRDIRGEAVNCDNRCHGNVFKAAKLLRATQGDHCPVAAKQYILRWNRAWQERRNDKDSKRPGCPRRLTEEQAKFAAEIFQQGYLQIGSTVVGSSSLSTRQTCTR